MSRRASSLFRGSELPRLLLLAAIVLAGWPMVVLFARPQVEDKPPPPAIDVSKLTPIVPDNSVEFQAIIDKAPMQTRESAAFAMLLQRARETPPADLSAKARRDIFWTHLWERPKLYRGVPVHFQGTVKKILTYEVSPTMVPSGRLFEAWIYSDENTSFPYVLSFEDPPKGLEIGHELHHRVTVNGYFLKLLGYRAGDHNRAAPMLVGRLNWTPAQAPAPAPMVELRNWTKRDGFVIAFVALFVYILFRSFFQVRKALSPSRERIIARAPSEGLPPEAVADWLQKLPAEIPESEEDVPPLRDEPHLRDR